MNQKLSGILFGLAAFAAWGFLPAYWKQMQAFNPFEILCHRIVWSCIFLAVIIGWQRRWHEVMDIINNPKTLRRLIFSSFLIGLNWFIYIWAVNTGRVVETSLGYYITPMINILLGFTLLGDRFNRVQWIAVFFALAGVLYSLVGYGALPLFALTLSVSFALYGFSRKKIDAAPIPGLFIETLVLFIPALAYIGFRVGFGTSPFLQHSFLPLWCLGSGIVTSLPLIWFAAAAKRLTLSTIGILQYLAPSIAFILGVFIYQEPFDRHNLITFGFIWIGVVLYIWESGQTAMRIKDKKRARKPSSGSRAL